jgi:dihydrofolate reductase
MARLTAFENISLDGFFVDADGQMSWAHDVPPDAEFDAFVAGNAKGGGVLVFGRVTYEMMAGYWSTPMAKANDPVVAERMNALPKIVFSRTLDRVSWNNTTLIAGDLVGEMQRLKRSAGPDLAILGSGSLIGPLAAAGLIDELQLVVVPIALGGGRTLFEGVREPIPLALSASRAFANGKVVLNYRPSS